MSSGTKPLNLLDRLQQRRSAVYLSLRRISCASHTAAEEFVSALSLPPLSTLVCVSRMCLSALSLTVSDSVCDTYTKRPKRKSRAHIDSDGTCVRRHATDASETNSGGLAIHSRVQSLGDSVSGGGGDSSGFRGSAFTAPPGGGGGRCRPHSMSDARF